MSTHTTKYLKDYKPSSYLIDAVDLTIELNETATIVTSCLKVRINSVVERESDALFLNGVALKLLSLKLNDVALKEGQFELLPDGLKIFHLPEQFELEIKTETNPKENKALSGLYLSRGIFCTQCESEGFRRITYFIDRPDILARFTTTIVAKKSDYPILLSNGNLIDSDDLANGLHFMKWEDPFLKPCYLFAMVAGKLDFIEDYFTTCSGRQVTLRIFCEEGHREQCRHAMLSLQKAMRWDEEQYGREYDLNLFMIVAVDDFNFGAMENKGLNIFNAKYIFVDPETATDVDYANVDRVVAHEYFHNWSGNRVTCRDWFQICLKEGFTVFRDQSFSEDVASKAISRIDEVALLRERQFPEDAGPLAHSIRPESYIEIDNFYTLTVYHKGAEVIRMLQTLLGKRGFRKGTDLYFKRFDGQAVTCEDFLVAMEEANDVDLSQFRLWYSQAGTPILYLASKYYEDEKEWHLAYSQSCPATPGQKEKLPMQIPLRMALFNSQGKEIPLRLKNEKVVVEVERTINIKKEEGMLVFVDVDEKPTPSFLRGFSAPVNLEYEYREQELAFLMAYDSDSYRRFDASQQFALRALSELVQQQREEKPLSVNRDFLAAYTNVLNDHALDQALLAKMLTLPSEQFLSEKQATIDIEKNHHAFLVLKKYLAEKRHAFFQSRYEENSTTEPYQYSVISSAKRCLRNCALSFLTALEQPEYFQLAYRQFQQADNMTDRLGALAALNDYDCKERETALAEFYERYQDNPLVMDKWFSIQAASQLPNTFERVKSLVLHAKFEITNPNRVYALLVTFSKNLFCFHGRSGDVYDFYAEMVLKIDAFNSHVAAKVIEPLAQWRRYDEERGQKMLAALHRILENKTLSNSIYEIATKAVVI